MQNEDRYTKILQQHTDREMNVILIDCGANSISLAVCLISHKNMVTSVTIPILGKKKLPGAIEFDDTMQKYVLHQLTYTFGSVSNMDKVTKQLFDINTTDLGHNINTKLAKTHKVQEKITIGTNTHLLDITHDEFESISGSLLTKISTGIDDIQKHGLEIFEVHCYGGFSQSTMIQNLIKKKFPSEILCFHARPQEIVVKGAGWLSQQRIHQKLTFEKSYDTIEYRKKENNKCLNEQSIMEGTKETKKNYNQAGKQKNKKRKFQDTDLITKMNGTANKRMKMVDM